MKPLLETTSIATSATPALVEPTWKFAWNRIASGPRIPSSMWTSNQ